MNVVTRFAPSPTGLLHAGNYRTAVFAYLYAKHAGGAFIVRIEDTDKERSRPEYEQNILEALHWLQLPADRTYRQSEHAGRHKELLEKLISAGAAYVSKEKPKVPGGREEVIRFKNPGGEVSFLDEIRGEIRIDVTDLGDFVIARSLEEPVFHFAVVVDDADEGVTHVIRGEDHISNTPRQILIQRALGFNTPSYGHLPLILGRDKSKLSKRRGAKALTEYRDMGVLPEAMLNYLSFLGWNPGDDKEYLSKAELIETFDLARVQKGSAIFDEVKLLSVNQHWMRALNDEEYLAHLGSALPKNALPIIRDRAQTFGEAKAMLDNELSFLFGAPVLAHETLVAKEPIGRPGLVKKGLKAFLGALEALSEDIPATAVKDILMPLADSEESAGKGGRGAVLWALRYALSGQERSPDPFTIISIVGSQEACARVKSALAILQK